MSKVSKLILTVVFCTLGAVVAMGQQSGAIGKLERNATPTVRNSATASSIRSEYVNSYYLGYDIEAAEQHIRKDETREILAQLVFLWDELYLQPEAPQVEALMRGIVRGQGTTDMKIAKLENIRTNIEARLKLDHKWYYSVGKNYSKMSIDIDNKDWTDFYAKLTELGKLGKTSPVGTPAEFAAALSKLGEYASKTDLSDNDVAVMKAQWDTIDKMIGAA